MAREIFISYSRKSMDYLMRRSVAIVELLLLPLFSSAQIEQPGFVKEYNEELAKTPLGNVEIRVKDAGQRVSDKDGSFMLRFRTKTAGEHVDIEEISKLDYEIFNKEAIEQWNISGSKKPFTIIMCNSKRFKKIKDNYNRLSSESYAKQFKKEQQALTAERDAGRLKEEEYQRKLIQLEDEYDKQRDSISTYIDRFARIDLSEISQAELSIIKLIQQGDFENAVSQYKALHLEQKFIQTRQSYYKLEEAEADIHKAKEDVNAARDSIFAQICRKNDALLLIGGKDNLREVEESYKQVAEGDTTFLEGLSAYLDFLFQRHRHQEELRYILLSIECCKKDKPQYLSGLYHSLGYAYLRLLSYEKAEEYFRESYQANEQYIARTSAEYQFNLAAYYGDMAEIYDHKGDSVEEERYRIKSLGIFRDLYSQGLHGYDIGYVLSLVGYIQYQIHHNPDKVDEAFPELENYLASNAENQDAWGQNMTNAMAATLNLQNTLLKGDTLQTEGHLKRFVKMYKPLYDKDPQAMGNLYGPMLAMLGSLYYQQDNYIDAQPMLEEAVNVLSSAVEYSFTSNITSLIASQAFLGMIKSEYGYRDTADSLLNAAYRNCEKMEALKLDFALDNRILCLQNLSKHALTYNDQANAEKYLKLQIEENEKIEAESKEEKHIDGTWFAYYNLGLLLYKQGRYEEAEDNLLQCIYFTEEGVTKAGTRDVTNLLFDIFMQTKHFDLGLKLADYCNEEADEKEKLQLMYIRARFYIEMGEEKKAQKIWKKLKEQGMESLDTDNTLKSRFDK